MTFLYSDSLNRFHCSLPPDGIPGPGETLVTDRLHNRLSITNYLPPNCLMFDIDPLRWSNRPRMRQSPGTLGEVGRGTVKNTPAQATPP
jgi:hypothetical protein